MHYKFSVLTHYRNASDAFPFGNRKKNLEDLFNSVLSQFKKYHPPGNLKFNNLGIFQSLKLRIVMEKILSIQKNFAPNSFGFNGFSFQPLIFHFR